MDKACEGSAKKTKENTTVANSTNDIYGVLGQTAYAVGQVDGMDRETALDIIACHERIFRIMADLELQRIKYPNNKMTEESLKAIQQQARELPLKEEEKHALKLMIEKMPKQAHDIVKYHSTFGRS